LHDLTRAFAAQRLTLEDSPAQIHAARQRLIEAEGSADHNRYDRSGAPLREQTVQRS
jgi:hypothetical protein